MEQVLEKPKAKDQKEQRPLTVAEKFPELEGVVEFVIRAYNPKGQLPVTARPCEDKTGRVFTGQGKTGHYETLSEEDKRSLPYVVTPDQGVVLTNDKTFRTDSTVDMINWAWLRIHPYISLTKERRGKNSKSASFYLYNPVHEATVRVSQSKLKDKARYLIQYEMNLEQLIRASKVLGDLGAETKNTLQLQDSLLQKTEDVSLVAMVLDACTSENSELSNAKILFTELQQYRIVQRGDGGQYRYGGEKGAILGHTPELVYAFFMDPKNSDTLMIIKNALNDAKNLK